MYKITSLFLSVLFITVPIISMEHANDSDSLSPFVKLPKDVSIIIIAGFNVKNVLRQTCSHFAELASRIKNENILLHPQLHLNQEALDRYLLYYGVLGNTAIVRNLLAKGANPNVREDNGISLMHYAMQYGYSDIVDLLAQHKVNIENSIKSAFSLNFLPAPQRNQPGGVVPSFLVGVKDYLVLCYAIKNGLYSMVQAVLECNAYTGLHKKDKATLLCFAIKAGHINIMKLLISKCAYVNGDEEGPLFSAVDKGYTSAVQLLIDYGVNVNIKEGKYGCTALYLASRAGQVQIVKILLEQGAFVNEKDNSGCIALHRASYGEHSKVEIVEMLLKNGAYVNTQDNDGYTPLDHASGNASVFIGLPGGPEDVKRLLITYGGQKSRELKESKELEEKRKLEEKGKSEEKGKPEGECVIQ